MEDDSPGLSVGFAIETGGSFAALMQLGDAMDSVEDKILREATAIERATGRMINLDGATASMTSFGTAATRELRDAAREMSRVEKAGESMVRQLDRQGSAFGKTREEMRAAKAETAALAAEQKGLTELAGRIRAAEGALFDKELASARRVRAEAEASAQAKDEAAARAVAAAAKEAQAVREATLAYNLFEAAARRGMENLRVQQAVEAAAAKEKEAQAVRSAAFAYQQFEAAARRGMDTLRAQQAREAAAASEAEAQALREASFAYQQFEAHARQAAAAMRETAAAEQQLANDARQVRSALDPMYAAQERFDQELTRADRLLAAGKLSQREYTQEVQRSRDVLYAHAQAVAGSSRGTAGLDAANRGAGQSLTQLSFQLNDVATMAMSGAAPMQILATQGGQVFQVFQQAQGGAKALASEIGGLIARFAPLAAVAAFTIGPIIAAGAAWSEYVGAIRQFSAVAQGAGRVAGLTGRDMEEIAEGANRAGKVTVAAAREIEAGYVSLGGIGKGVLQDLILFTRDFAAATGTDAAGATQTLGAAFQDPIKGAEELTGKFGVLTQAQIEHIRHAVEQNDVYGAQRYLLDALGPAFEGAADHAGALTRAWRSIRDAASEAWTAMGHAIDVALGGGSTLDKINNIAP